MATAVFARDENSVSNDIDDPNDDVFSSNASDHPAPPSAAVVPNIPRTQKKPALPSAPKAATFPDINRYLSCNGDVQVNGQHDAALGSSNIMVDHFEVLQRTLRACRESLDRIDRFRNQSDRKRRLAYAARAFGLTTKPPPLVTSHHLAPDVTAVENRCAVDNSNTCSPAISGANTCTIRGPEAVRLPSWCTTLSASSSPSLPPIRPAASPYHHPPPTTGASLSTSPPTASPATPTEQLDSPMMMTPMRPDTGVETDSPLSSPNHARPCSPPPPPPPPPSNRNGAFPSSSSVYAAPTAPSTNQPPTTHPPSSSTPTCPPCASSSSTTTHSVPSQQPSSKSAAGHVPRTPSSASSTPPSSSAHSHPPPLLLYIDQGQKRARSRPGGLSGPRVRSHSDGGGGGGGAGGGWENGGVMQQAEVEEITVEFEEAVGMADLVESTVDEVETNVDDDEDEDGQVDGTTETGGFGQEGTWLGCPSQVVNGLFSITEEDQTISINDGELRERSGKDGWGTRGQTNSEGFYGSSNLEKITNFDSSWPEDPDELISYRLSDATEDEKDYTPRSLSQRPRTCLYRGRRTRMEREAKFGGKLRVRFADDVGGERDGDLGKDSSERRKRICATSDHKEEHPLDWLQADALDRRMNLIEENVLYIQDSLDRLLRSDDPKLGRYDVIDSGCEAREAETSTRDDPSSSQYSHHHYHHYHHLSRSIIVVFVMCMIFILCILLLLPVAIRTVSIAYIPGQSVF